MQPRGHARRECSKGEGGAQRWHKSVMQASLGGGETTRECKDGDAHALAITERGECGHEPNGEIHPMSKVDEEEETVNEDDTSLKVTMMAC